MFYLPTTLEVDGKEYPIRTDFRVALTIFEAINDKSLPRQLIVPMVLKCLYIDIPENTEEAYKKATWFLDGGDIPKSKKAPKKIMDWEQDEYLIFPALNKVAGCEIRSVDYMHWWTFFGLFNEVGDGLYSQVINIRSKLANGKKLEKWEREYFEKHKEMIVIKEKLSPEEEAELKAEEDYINQLIGL